MKRLFCLVVAVLGLWLGAPVEARADEPPRPVDPWVVASVTTLSGGAAMVVAGSALWAAPAPEETVCGARAGCATVERSSDTRAPGTFLVGAGIADAVFGAVSLAIVELRPPGRIRSPAMAVTGLSILGMSVGMLGGGLLLGSVGEEGRFDSAIPWLVASAVSFTVGVPLLAAGAQSKTEPSFQNAGLIAGGSIFVLGGLTGFTTLVYAATQSHGGDFLNFEKPMLVLGALECLGAGLGAGIPMLVVGARAPVAAPSISISPSRVGATWAF